MGYSYYGTGSGIGVIVWTILAIIFAIAGGILVYVLFSNSKKNMKLGKFGSWLKEFLNFNFMITEVVLKVLYLISTIFVVLYSFTCFAIGGGTGFLSFLLCIVFGPIIIRLVYEGILMFIMLWKNTNDINKKIK